MVFWSDHGEMAGDHGSLYKSVFYESSLRVPLIVRWPGKIPAGQTCSALAETIDVYPTLLEIAGVEPAKRCQGQSFWSCLWDSKAPHRDAVFSEITRAGHYTTMVRTERYKYAVEETGEGYLLFDVEEDPTEQRNLVGHPDYAHVEREMRERLFAFQTGTQIQI